MNGKESKSYKSVLACFTDIIASLEANRPAKDALILEYQREKWISITATLTEKELVILVLDRISNDAGQYDIFINMLKNIEGMNLILNNLKGNVRFLNSNMITKYTCVRDV